MFVPDKLHLISEGSCYTFFADCNNLCFNCVVETSVHGSETFFYNNSRKMNCFPWSSLDNNWNNADNA